MPSSFLEHLDLKHNRCPPQMKWYSNVNTTSPVTTTHMHHRGVKLSAAEEVNQKKGIDSQTRGEIIEYLTSDELNLPEAVIIEMLQAIDEHWGDEVNFSRELMKAMQQVPDKERRVKVLQQVRAIIKKKGNDDV